MSDVRAKSSHHVWRWRDEDPEAIVLLVIILLVIIAVPWRGCGLSAVRGDARPVARAAATSIADGMSVHAAASPVPAAAAPAPDEAAPLDAPTPD